MRAAEGLALYLLRNHRRDLAKAVVAECEMQVPSLAIVDREARIAAEEQLISAAAKVLAGGSPGPLIQLVQQTLELRRAAGLGYRALLACIHVYGPVIRRFFMAASPDRLVGLDAYEEIEARILRLLMDLTISLLPPELDMEDEERDTITEPGIHKPATLSPFPELA